MRFLKIVGVAVGVLVVLAAAGAFLIASQFDPNDYKDEAARLFEARTGRTLGLEEELALDFFPWLAVATGRVTIGHSSDFPIPAGDRPFATVARAEARVRLLPLLGRRLEIGVVELEGLELNLARDAEGRGNWEDLLADRDAGAADGRALADERALEVAGVRIRDGVVRWYENVEDLRYTVSGLDLATGAIAGGRPVELELSLAFRDEAAALNATLAASAAAELGAGGAFAARALDATFTARADAAPEETRGRLRAASVTADSGGRIRLEQPSLDGTLAHPLAAGRTVPVTVAAAALAFDPAAQTLALDGLKTEIGGIAADWELTVGTPLDAPSVEGTVRAAGDTTALFELAALEPPSSVAPQDLGSFALSSRFAWASTPAEARLADLVLDVLGMQIQGGGTLRDGRQLDGRLAVAEFAPNAAVQALLRGAVPPTVDVSALDRLAFAARFETDLTTQRAAIRELEANVFGASVSGELEAIPGAGGNVFRGAIKTSRFEPTKLVQAFRELLSDKIDAAELGMLELDAGFVFDSAADSVTFAPLTAEVFGLRGNAEVTGRSVSTAAQWSGRVEVAQFSPRELMRRFGQPVPETSDPAALTRAAIDTRFTLDVRGEQSRFDALTLTLDDSRIRGDFTLTGFQNPRYAFTLAIDQVDADRYLPPPADEAAAGQKTAGDIELPADSPLVLDGQVEVGALKLANLSFQDVATRVSLGGGDAKLDSARARLYGGEFAGSFHAITSAAAPGLRLEGRAANLTLAPLIEALTGETANFSGTGDFELRLAGQGKTVIENVHTAGGNVAFALRNGAVQGFNLGRTLCAAYNALDKRPAPPDRPKATEYLVIQGTADVANGVAASRDLLARTTFMDITGRGTLALVEQQLDYDLDATLTGRIDIPGCETMEPLIGGSIPFDIRGTVVDPTITPDFSEIIKRRIENEVRERVQDRLQDRLRDLLR